MTTTSAIKRRRKFSARKRGEKGRSTHFCAILMNVSHAISCTPSCVSCANSNNLLTTVLRNFQCAFKKRGYCPTMYMIFEALSVDSPRRLAHARDTVDRRRGWTHTTALLSFPRFISVNPSKSVQHPQTISTPESPLTLQSSAAIS